MKQNIFKIHFLLLLALSLFSKEISAVSKEMRFDSYTQENGLPDNQILCINQDIHGWIWLGTNHGLSRFDGYRFKNFLPSSKDSISIKGLVIWAIFEDRKGNLWVGTENGGLNLYNRELEQFDQPFGDDPEYKSSLANIYDIEEDQDGNLWVATIDDVLKIDTLGQITQISKLNNDKRFSFGNQIVTKLEFDNSGRLWIGTKTYLYIVDQKAKSIDRFDLLSNNKRFFNIKDLFLDSDKKMWVTTDTEGAFIVDPITMEIIPIVFEPEIERSKTVRKVTEDEFGNYWICTRAGLYEYNKLTRSTNYYSHDEREPYSLTHNSVISVFIDKNGEIWIGTRQGLNLLAQSKQIFHNYGAHPSDRTNKYLNCNSVYALWADAEQNIWIGTEDGGVNIYSQKTQLYSYLTHDINNPKSISNNCIKAFLNDQRGNLWIGSFHGGIDVLDLKTKNIKHYKNEPSNPKSLISNEVWDFALDNNGNIWIATSTGVDQYEPTTNKFIHYPQLSDRVRINWIEKDAANNMWFGSNNEIVIYNLQSGSIKRFKEYSISFIEDSKGRYWITTFDKGIAQYSIANGAIQYYDMDDGLANNQALCILEDNDQKLWISTSNGLSKFDPDNQTFQNFTIKDGIQNNVFCYGAAYKLQNGELLFGGISGFNLFDPAEVKINNNPVPLVLTELRVANRKAEIGFAENAILKKSINVTDHLEFNYNKNSFSLEFAALNYTSSESNLYSYFLEGFDQIWSDPGTNRIATYTNIDPGDYIFHVCRVVDSIKQHEHELQVSIKVFPPFWKRLWFRILAFIVLFSLINLIILFFIFRERTKMGLVLERVKANKLNELNNLKLKFFTNISHEIRTPLTLILTPLEKLRSKKYQPNEIDSYVEIMYRNTQNLNNLINQLLDFRKLEAKSLKLEVKKGDIVHFVAEIVSSYHSFAIEKGITLKFSTFHKSLEAHYDPDKIGKIVNNLLSNAFKFTEKNGRVTVNLVLAFDNDVKEFSNKHTEQECIEISVTDTGSGIAEKYLSKIFDRFYQAEVKDEQTGTGIGLSFVKELVKLHNGKIFVESAPGKGSKFTFRIPYEKDIIDDRDGLTLEIPNTINSKNEVLNVHQLEGSIMLIVDDNPDVRLLIKDHFRDNFQVYEANNGKEGWSLTLDIIPDIIISDVLMPDMNGFEFCKKVKNDERTSHIPLLLLTALHSKEHVIKGLECSADDYITKPFDLAILQTKIENILSLRNSYKEKYSTEVTLQPTNIRVSSPDQKFLQRAIEVVEAHIDDVELDLERFVLEVGVSRMQLYRKLKALTDMTVKEFIKSIRLKRAAQLLVQDTMTVSEIAYAVGFKEISRFRKSFRQAYGMNATEYKLKNKNKSE